MAVINYKIEVFEGPMDLLLHLISKHKIDIYDIPIIELVDQYTAYIREMQKQDLDVASEFLEMAARLVHIKSLSLLPVYDEAEELKKELTGELIEYAACKHVALALAEQTKGFNYISKPMDKIEGDMTYTRIHDPLELLNAYMNVVGKRLRKMPPPFDSFRTIVAKKIVSVSGKIKNIIDDLILSKKRQFSEILNASESRSDMVAAFLAVLELAKTKHVHIEGSQDDFTIELLKVPEGELDFD